MGRPLIHDGDADDPDLTEREKRCIRRQIPNRESAQCVRLRWQGEVGELEVKVSSKKTYMADCQLGYPGSLSKFSRRAFVIRAKGLSQFCDLICWVCTGGEYCCGEQPIAALFGRDCCSACYTGTERGAYAGKSANISMHQSSPVCRSTSLETATAGNLFRLLPFGVHVMTSYLLDLEI